MEWIFVVIYIWIDSFCNIDFHLLHASKSVSEMGKVSVAESFQLQTQTHHSIW